MGILTFGDVRPSRWNTLRAPACVVLVREGLAIDFFAVADAEAQDEKAVVVDFRDEAIVTYAVFPELAEAGAVQRFSHTPWVVQFS